MNHIFCLQSFTHNHQSERRCFPRENRCNQCLYVVVKLVSESCTEAPQPLFNSPSRWETHTLARVKEKPNENMLLKRHSDLYHTPGSSFTVITMSRKTPIYSPPVCSPRPQFCSLIGWLSGTRAAVPLRDLNLLLLYFLFPPLMNPTGLITLQSEQSLYSRHKRSSVSFVFMWWNTKGKQAKLQAWAQSQNKVGPKRRTKIKKSYCNRTAVTVSERQFLCTLFTSMRQSWHWSVRRPVFACLLLVTI